MVAIRKNLVNNHRTRLERVIPLDLPLIIFIDPCNMCNFKCDFCAVQSSNRPLKYKKQIMSMELFQKIINDLSGNKIKTIRFGAQGEPLLNKSLPDMVKYTKEKCVTEKIEVVTNGSLFEPELNEKIVNSGVDRIKISIEAVDAEGYQNVSHINLDFEKFVSNIQDLYKKSRGKCEIYIKTVDIAVNTTEKKERFYSLFESICDKINIDNVIPAWSGFDELEERIEIRDSGLYGQKKKEVMVCPFPFYSCLICPDGDVTVCCSDWERKNVIGNVKGTSFGSIWNGDKMNSFLLAMLEGKRNKMSLCSACLYPEYNCIDNLDDFAEEIKNRWTKGKWGKVL